MLCTQWIVKMTEVFFVALIYAEAQIMPTSMLYGGKFI